MCGGLQTNKFTRQQANELQSGRGASFFPSDKTSRVGMNKFAIGKCLCFVDIKNVR